MPISKKCQLALDKSDTVNTLNKMLKELQVQLTSKHHCFFQLYVISLQGSSLQHVYEIFPEKDSNEFIYVVQSLVPRGSLKDMIHKTCRPVQCCVLATGSCYNIHDYRMNLLWKWIGM